ncbi:MAG TPA: response regulator [Burkholderiaceae bacterium]
MNTVPNIAMVENDRATSTALRRLLLAQGYAVEVFHSAESYLTRTSCVPVDCLLLDVDLDGMSGLELQRRISRPEALVPVVFMTGRHDTNVELCAREQGCAAFLYKPFEGRLLADAIDGALAAPHATSRISSSRGTPC